MLIIVILSASLSTTSSAEDAWDHIIQSTFSRESSGSVVASHHSTISSQQRKITNARDKITLHNNRVLEEKAGYYTRREESGVLCCTAINEESGMRCMSTFATKSGRETSDERQTQLSYVRLERMGTRHASWWEICVLPCHWEHDESKRFYK